MRQLATEPRGDTNGVPRILLWNQWLPSSGLELTKNEVDESSISLDVPDKGVKPFSGRHLFRQVHHLQRFRQDDGGG